MIVHRAITAGIGGTPSGAGIARHVPLQERISRHLGRPGRGRLRRPAALHDAGDRDRGRRGRSRSGRSLWGGPFMAAAGRHRRLSDPVAGHAGQRQDDGHGARGRGRSTSSCSRLSAFGNRPVGTLRSIPYAEIAGVDTARLAARGPLRVRTQRSDALELAGGKFGVGAAPPVIDCCGVGSRHEARPHLHPRPRPRRVGPLLRGARLRAPRQAPVRDRLQRLHGPAGRRRHARADRQPRPRGAVRHRRGLQPHGHDGRRHPRGRRPSSPTRGSSRRSRPTTRAAATSSARSASSPTRTATGSS